MTALTSRSIPQQQASPSANRPPALLRAGQKLRRYRSAARSTPGLLRIALLAIWSLCALTVLAAAAGVERHRGEMQTIGKDAAPSIIAAQDIRANLEDMEVNAARMLLARDDAGSAASAYEQRREAASRALVAAAENITYGDIERVPIRSLVFALGSFEQEMASARALRQRSDPGYLPRLREADRVLHDRLLPAADALDNANLDALNHAYSDERLFSGLATAAFVVTGLALAAALFITQLFLYRRMRRVFNPLLVAATGVVACLLVSMNAAFHAESSALKAVKEDAFDSIHALSRARAYAIDARACQLLRVVDPQEAQALDLEFASNATKLVALEPGQTLDSIVSDAASGGPCNGFTGCLADELHNITYTGEREAAVGTLREYAGYLNASDRARRLIDTGDPRGTDIILSDLAEAPPSATPGCGYSFSRFDAALDQTRAINQRELDAAVARGMDAVASMSIEGLVLLAIVAVLAYFGLRPRLKEYAR